MKDRDGKVKYKYQTKIEGKMWQRRIRWMCKSMIDGVLPSITFSLPDM
jgi:hypothetical protein